MCYMPKEILENKPFSPEKKSHWPGTYYFACNEIKLFACHKSPLHGSFPLHGNNLTYTYYIIVCMWVCLLCLYVWITFLKICIIYVAFFSLSLTFFIWFDSLVFIIAFLNFPYYLPQSFNKFPYVPPWLTQSHSIW